MVCTLLLLVLVLLLLLLLLCPDYGELGVPPVDGPDQLQARLVVHRQLVHWQPRLDEHPLRLRRPIRTELQNVIILVQFIRTK